MSAMLRRRVPSMPRFVCSECNKAFRSREELSMHTELCLLDAFEFEASAVFSDMSTGEPLAEEAPPILTPESRHEEPAVIKVKEEKLAGAGSGKVVIAVPPASQEPATRRPRIAVGTPNHPASAGALHGHAYTPTPRASLPLPAELEEGEAAAFQERMFAEMPPKPLGRRPMPNPNNSRPKMECPTCGVILYRHNFSTHYRIHTGELPFPCQYCDRRFRTSTALTVHTRSHTGEKPYKCPHCEYACITKRNLDRHIHNNHEKKRKWSGPKTRKPRLMLVGAIALQKKQAAAARQHQLDEEELAEEDEAEMEEQEAEGMVDEEEEEEATSPEAKKAKKADGN